MQGAGREATHCSPLPGAQGLLEDLCFWGSAHVQGQDPEKGRKGREGNSPDLGDIPGMGDLFPPSAGDFSRRKSPASGRPAKNPVQPLNARAPLVVLLKEGLMIQRFAQEKTGGTHSSPDQLPLLFL